MQRPAPTTQTITIPCLSEFPSTVIRQKLRCSEVYTSHCSQYSYRIEEEIWKFVLNLVDLLYNLICKIRIQVCGRYSLYSLGHINN